MTFDLYAWKAPRDLDADAAEALIERWQATGGDPAASPFEPSADVGWFYRELRSEAPHLVMASDAVPSTSRTPIWMTGTNEPPARVVAMRLAPDASRDIVGAILGLAMKYDLVLFDPRSRRVRLPLEEMAAYASATFWPRGAIRATVAGLIGAALAVVAWIMGIALLSGVLVIVGGFLVVMAMWTFIHEGRKALRERRDRVGSPRG